MAKYLLLKHYRGGPEPLPQSSVPMEEWTPQEITDHIAFMDHVARCWGSAASTSTGKPCRRTGPSYGSTARASRR